MCTEYFKDLSRGASLKALILGVSGQDGAYLSQFLLNKGYEVVGTSRDIQTNAFKNLDKLNIQSDVEKVSLAINDFHSVLSVVESVAPDEIYNLAGQSSVGLSFEQPVETMDSIAGGTLNILEAIRFVNQSIRFYNAGSSECFGDTSSRLADENMPFHPNSPYAVAKASAHWLVANYRVAYNLFASTGILFNHESPLRPERFVTQKIVRAAARIAKGSNERLALGNIKIERDWGWAPEYVTAMWKMLQQSQAYDYVIATGRTVSLEYFVSHVFEYFQLDWQRYVDLDNSLYRPSDLISSNANVTKANSQLDWIAQYKVDDVIAMMCESAITDLNDAKD